MSDDLEELKALIVSKMDELELLDILGIDMDELVNLLEEQIEENRQELYAVL